MSPFHRKAKARKNDNKQRLINLQFCLPRAASRHSTRDWMRLKLVGVWFAVCPNRSFCVCATTSNHNEMSHCIQTTFVPHGHHSSCSKLVVVPASPFRRQHRERSTQNTNQAAWRTVTLPTLYLPSTWSLQTHRHKPG